MSAKSFFLGMLAGVAIGAAVGILFAPERGSITRRRIGDSFSSFGDRASGVAQSMGQSVTSLKSQVQQSAQKATERIKQAI